MIHPLIKNTLALLLALFTLTGTAQSPYHFHLGRELAFIGGGGVTVAAGVLLKDKTTLFTIAELEQLDPGSVKSFDRRAIYNTSQSARNASDYFLYGSHALPLLLLAGREVRQDFGALAFLWGETLLINGGLTFAAKYAFRRPRPYVYNEEIATSEKLTTSAKTAFFSGHTSMVAANAFFTAKVFSDYYPESKWKPVVWSVAAAVPAITGYLRVEAGRHYPSDVIAGYFAGALAGYLVPHLHKKARGGQKGVELYGGMNGALLRVVF